MFGKPQQNINLFRSHPGQKAMIVMLNIEAGILGILGKEAVGFYIPLLHIIWISLPRSALQKNGKS